MSVFSLVHPLQLSDPSIYSFLCKCALSVHIIKKKTTWNFILFAITYRGQKCSQEVWADSQIQIQDTMCSPKTSSCCFFFLPEHRVINQNTMHLQYAYRLVLDRKTGTWNNCMATVSWPHSEDAVAASWEIQAKTEQRLKIQHWRVMRIRQPIHWDMFQYSGDCVKRRSPHRADSQLVVIAIMIMLQSDNKQQMKQDKAVLQENCITSRSCAMRSHID